MEQQKLLGDGVLREDGRLPVSRETAEHYGWGDPEGSSCDGWHLLRSAGLSVIEERMPPGIEEVRHMHQRARQFFYVLAGEMTLETEGVESLLLPGHGLEIAPGIWHQAINRSGQDTRFLVVSQPPSHGDRVAE